jgi:hypothetical protein
MTVFYFRFNNHRLVFSELQGRIYYKLVYSSYLRPVSEVKKKQGKIFTTYTRIPFDERNTLWSWILTLGKYHIKNIHKKYIVHLNPN